MKNPRTQEQQETEQAAERVSAALEHDVPEDDLDPADAERVADATASAQTERTDRRTT
ncbi:hypothetical protein GCM10027589_12700 [Actinocorallia lasiicapitis]